MVLVLNHLNEATNNRGQGTDFIRCETAFSERAADRGDGSERVLELFIGGIGTLIG